MNTKIHVFQLQIETVLLQFMILTVRGATAAVAREMAKKFGLEWDTKTLTSVIPVQ